MSLEWQAYRPLPQRRLKPRRRSARWLRKARAKGWRFGIQIEPQFGFTYDEVAQIAKEAERRGFYGLWASDHLFWDSRSEQRNCLEAWTLLTALAPVTTELRLGTLVTCNSYRPPSILAKIASSLDHLSNGRLEFGIGAGWKELEYRAYGIPFPSIGTRLSQLEEAVQVVRLFMDSGTGLFFWHALPVAGGVVRFPNRYSNRHEYGLPAAERRSCCASWPSMPTAGTSC